MTSNTLLLIVGLLVGLACFVYILFASRRLAQARQKRVDSQSAAPPAATAEPGTATGAPSPPADLPSPFLPAADGEPDELLRIKGIGPKLSARLAELGVFHYRQIADWTPDQLAAVDAQLGTFQGRPERDQWQSQARLLASGDLKAYERVHGKLESPAPPAPPGPAA